LRPIAAVSLFNIEKKIRVADQFAVKEKTKTICWTKKLNKEDYNYLLLLADKVAVRRSV